MFPIRSTAICAVIAPLVLQGVAVAQPVLPTQSLNFTPVGSGLALGDANGGEKVIETAAAYKAFLGVDAPASVQFGQAKGKDVVLAVRRNGWLASSSISIEKVTLGFEAGIAASVEFRTKGGAPNPFTLPPVGNVYVAVKVKRPFDGFKRFSFRDVTHPQKFTKLTLTIHSANHFSGTPIATTKTLTVDEDGNTKLTFGPPVAPLSGSLPIAQLLDLEKKFVDAQVDTLPSDLTQVVHIVAPLETYALEAAYPGGSSKMGGEPGIFAQNAQRAKPLVDKLYAIAKGLEEKAAEIDIHGVVGVNGGTVTVTPVSGIQPPPGMPPVVGVQWRVVNEPFFSILKARKGKFVHVHARRIQGVEPIIQVLSVSGDNDTNVTVRDAQGKYLGTIGKNQGVTVTGVHGLNYEVDFNGQKGYVRKSKVDIGSTAIPLAAAPSATPGLTGSIDHHD